MGIIDTIFLIIGIFLIITITLIIVYCKLKLPEKELNYISYLITYLMGILLIIGVITGSIWFILLFVLLLAFLDRIYRSKKYPEKYKPMSIWEKLGFVWVILLISTILYIAFFH
ncbi:hypothetical protein A9507_03290 [Methanobacterium sp. A39]|uniref:Uncharacterized protein n=1 Tax=Methanobacterium bryantii TaxID=2161 RepID=A0A2A2H5V0_METBR|nr:hypothetical protein A9507_03290 [Methanobacterium sp. A39]PAV04728.1 hypothetical protein ASJ80_10455 [Methanobacterium bryantii]